MKVEEIFLHINETSRKHAALITSNFLLVKTGQHFENSAICLKQKSKVVRERKMRNQTVGLSINIHVKDRIL